VFNEDDSFPGLAAAQSSHWILFARRLPPRLNRRQLCVRLNIDDEEGVTTLVEHNMIDPIGGHRGNEKMYFFTGDVERRANNRKWVSKMTLLLKSRDTAKKPRRAITNLKGGPR